MELSPISNISSHNIPFSRQTPITQEVNTNAQRHSRNIHRNGSLEPIQEKSIAYIFGEQVVEPLIKKISDLFDWFFSSPQPSTPPPRRVCLGQSKDARIAEVQELILSALGIENKEQLDRLNEEARKFKKTHKFAQKMFDLWKNSSNHLEKKTFVDILKRAQSQNRHVRRFLEEIHRIQESQSNETRTTVSN